ncbi:MAG: uncharacterized protein PWP31_1493 [Clostridia bacterium]|nr:uncharacterized protein [Clostridia bacterium]
MGLSKLWELQEIQLRQHNLEDQLKNSTLAFELKKEKERLTAFQEKIRSKMLEYKQLKKEIKNLESTCKDLEFKKNSIKNKLYSGEVNNFKELYGLEQQIEASTNDLAHEEEKYLELLLEQERLEGWLKVNSQKLKEEKEDYRKKLEKYRAWHDDLQQEIDILKVNAIQIEQDIEPSLRDIYVSLKKRLGNKALARVVKGTCSGCNLVIPPVLLRKVRSGKIVYCESCDRLLLP